MVLWRMYRVDVVVVVVVVVVLCCHEELLLNREVICVLLVQVREIRLWIDMEEAGEWKDRGISNGDGDGDGDSDIK